MENNNEKRYDQTVKLTNNQRWWCVAFSKKKKKKKERKISKRINKNNIQSLIEQSDNESKQKFT